MENILEVKNLSKHFYGLKAVNDLSFSIKRNQIFGLIGPNGAGKTTVFNCLTSFLPVTSGNIIFNNEDVTDILPHKLCKKGLVRTFQANRLFMELTVRENVMVAAERAKDVGILQEFFSLGNYKNIKNEINDKTDEILEFTDLSDKSEVLAKNLPHGNQRLLGVAIALATEPEMLLLDEPLTGITMAEMDDFLEIINKIRDSGVTICLVEHNMRAVMSICENILVINYGERLAEGKCEEVRNNEEVIEAYLGRRD